MFQKTQLNVATISRRLAELGRRRFFSFKGPVTYLLKPLLGKKFVLFGFSFPFVYFSIFSNPGVDMLYCLKVAI